MLKSWYGSSTGWLAHRWVCVSISGYWSVCSATDLDCNYSSVSFTIIKSQSKNWLHMEYLLCSTTWLFMYWSFISTHFSDLQYIPSWFNIIVATCWRSPYSKTHTLYEFTRNTKDKLHIYTTVQGGVKLENCIESSFWLQSIEIVWICSLSLCNFWILNFNRKKRN